jgi:hemerythrin-like metal-binding protein
MTSHLSSWTNRLSVGVVSLDDDHKILIDLLNDLHDGILAGHGAVPLGFLLGGLVNYTQFHFAREEDFFAQFGYPSAAAHLAEHEQLLRRLMEIQEDLKANPHAGLPLERAGMLKDWIMGHIEFADQKYSGHLKAHGLS